MAENKKKIVEEMTKVLNMTDYGNGIRVKTGYLDPKRNACRIAECFVPDENRLEYLLFTWEGQSDEFGAIQQIECDSGYAVILDMLKAVSRM